jgi:hypothetical protein
MEKIAILKQKIEQLRNLDFWLKIFGAGSHQYQFNPCLSEAEITAFEQKHQIELPEDYRNFLLHIGNGGACDGYGMYPIEDYFGGLDAEQASQQYPDFLSAPFPHTTAWNDYDLMDMDREYEDEYNDGYYAHRYIQGSVLLAYQGCTIELRLVVSGAEKGNVWMDDRGADTGIVPLHSPYHPEKHLDFFTWYNHWLDRSLEEIKAKSAAKPVKSDKHPPIVSPIAVKSVSPLQRFFSLFRPGGK